MTEPKLQSAAGRLRAGALRREALRLGRSTTIIGPNGEPLAIEAVVVVDGHATLYVDALVASEEHPMDADIILTGMVNDFAKVRP